MQHLKGKSILIGKDPLHGKLTVAIVGSNLKTAIGPENSVPPTVSRCIPEQNIGHARLSIDNSGNIMLTNLKPQNVTYVNGSAVLSKQIDKDTIIELGAKHFQVSLTAILSNARMLVLSSDAKAASDIPPVPPTPQSNTFHIAYLEDIWNQYEAEIERIQNKQKRNNTIRALQGVLSMSGIVIGVITAACGFAPIGIILSSVALIIGIISFIFTKNDTSAEDRKQALDTLEDNYLCPNPNCRKSLPTKRYKWIKLNYTTCSYCKAKFIP